MAPPGGWEFINRYSALKNIPKTYRFDEIVFDYIIGSKRIKNKANLDDFVYKLLLNGCNYRSSINIAAGIELFNKIKNEINESLCSAFLYGSTAKGTAHKTIRFIEHVIFDETNFIGSIFEKRNIFSDIDVCSLSNNPSDIYIYLRNYLSNNFHLPGFFEETEFYWGIKILNYKEICNRKTLQKLSLLRQIFMSSPTICMSNHKKYNIVKNECIKGLTNIDKLHYYDVERHKKFIQKMLSKNQCIFISHELLYKYFPYIYNEKNNRLSHEDLVGAKNLKFPDPSESITKIVINYTQSIDKIILSYKAKRIT